MGIYKKYCLYFQSTLLKAVFPLFCFSLYKMVDNGYFMNIHKSVKISIEAVIKNAEILKFAPDHLKTKKMCKH